MVLSEESPIGDCIAPVSQEVRLKAVKPTTKGTQNILIKASCLIGIPLLISGFEPVTLETTNACNLQQQALFCFDFDDSQLALFLLQIYGWR